MCVGLPGWLRPSALFRDDERGMDDAKSKDMDKLFALPLFMTVLRAAAFRKVDSGDGPLLAGFVGLLGPSSVANGPLSWVSPWSSKSRNGRLKFFLRASRIRFRSIFRVLQRWVDLLLPIRILLYLHCYCYCYCYCYWKLWL